MSCVGEPIPSRIELRKIIFNFLYPSSENRRTVPIVCSGLMMGEAMENRVLSCVTKNYANFKGRAPRSEYWLFMLAIYVLAFVLGAIDGLLGTFDPFLNIGAFSGIATLVLLIPIVSVHVRRLHDTDRSGWWFLISLIPIIGTIWLIVLMVLAGSPAVNRFGSNPLNLEVAEISE
jgi:uncharacterized membrane protein YhaH (DUF805 family)